MPQKFSQVPPKEGKKIKLSFSRKIQQLPLEHRSLILSFLPLEEDDVTACVWYGYQDEFHFHTLG